MCGLNITLSTSEKSLKEQIIAYLDKIKTELEVINTVDNKIEVLAEYKSTLDLKQSILTVCERKEREAEELKKQQKIEEELCKSRIVKAEDNLYAPNVRDEEEITAPKVIEEEKKYTMTFTVTGTMEQLKELKQYLVNNNLLEREEK